MGTDTDTGICGEVVSHPETPEEKLPFPGRKSRYVQEFTGTFGKRVKLLSTGLSDSVRQLKFLEGLMHKILLVNASRYFIDEGKNLLDRRDFQVFLAPTGGLALELHRRERVNLIVADLDLPEMAGDTLCSRIREDAELCSVSFILVCHNNPAELIRAAQCGANVSLHKPFTAATLFEHVEKLLAISVRRGYRVLLRARVLGAKDDTAFFCTSQNISGSGMLIETDRSLLHGEQLTFSFFLPGAAQITATGEVVRTETAADGKHHYGVIFTGLAAAHKSAIEEFIAGTVTQS